MKVTRKNNPQQALFVQLGTTECFSYRGMLYIKLSKYQCEYNAFCVDESILYTLVDETQVIPVEAECTYWLK